MKQVKIKIIGTILVTMMLLVNIPAMSQAKGTFTPSISKTSVTVGDTFTVTAAASNATGTYNVSVSDNSKISIIKSPEETFLENNSQTWTFKANKEGKVSITVATVDMSDSDDDTKSVVGTQTYTVTVKEKETPTTNTTTGGNTATGNSTTGKTNTTTEKNTADNHTTSGGNTTTEYKPTFTSVNETVYATNEVNVRESYSTTSKKLGALKKGDSITRTGKSTDGKWSKVTYQGKTAYISSAYLTTTKPEVKKSGNKNLASLTIKGVELSPAFNKETTQYTATVSNEITKLEIDAIPEDSKAKVEITDNNELKTGDNIIKIKVTAEDDTVRTYMLTVTKNENKETIENNKSTNSDELQLTNLKIKGVDFEQGFNPSIYTYELTLNNAKVKSLEITATPNQENAQVEIIGNENFKVGENIITILLTSADGTKTTNYQIKANLPEGTAETKRENETTQTMFYVIIGIVVATIIIAIALLISRHRKNMDMDTEDDDNEMIIEENRADEILGISDTEETKKRSKGKHSK